MSQQVSDSPFISRWVKAFMNYPLTLSLCAKYYGRDSLCTCYGGKWWWWRRRGYFFLRITANPTSLYHHTWYRYAILMAHSSIYFPLLPPKSDNGKYWNKCFFLLYLHAVYLTSSLGNAKLGQGCVLLSILQEWRSQSSKRPCSRTTNLPQFNCCKE